MVQSTRATDDEGVSIFSEKRRTRWETRRTSSTHDGVVLEVRAVGVLGEVVQHLLVRVDVC